MDSKHSGKLALFDLDNTLLAGDSDHAWGEFLINRNLVNEDKHRQENDYFYEQYKQGKLDIHGYVKFTLTPILQMNATERDRLHQEFMKDAIAPLVLDSAQSLVARHKSAGDFCIIISATNEFITTPIAKEFQVDHLISTELEINNGSYTGNISGTPCYQAGKVEKLQRWLDSRNDDMRISEAVFYSDSINDLPLLEQVATPVVVDPDDQLRDKAQNLNWEIISLRT
ncbi:MAG: HAD-IB family hydrolase [SAR86 cluster bacterium]|uniref:HAD-IB family hydrolase n=1 Tax=SAR86 cluster bacterium TaxID=2030880 RepID=A0A2A5BAN4_9GAMM|nr:MAG: HAD-IB family hydrolase [SAR86 cluster bacterium]